VKRILAYFDAHMKNLPKENGMYRRTLLQILVALTLLFSVGAAIGAELIPIKKSEIIKKANLAADHVIEASKRVAEAEQREWSVENEENFRKALVEAYLRDVELAGTYYAYDPL
jgi:hypothetical protein